MIHHRKFLWSIMLLIGTITFVSCGGGGDDGTPAPTPTPTGIVTKFAILDGTQAGTTATANGTGTLTVDRGTGAVSGFLAVQSAPPSAPAAAHVHDGARGVSGGVQVTLTNSGAGVWSVPAGTVLTAAQVASFDVGSLYFAVHTGAAGEPAGGLIRGQIDQTSITLFARLDGAQEVPVAPAPDPVNTTANGTGSMTVVADTGAASGSLTIGTPPATAIGQAHVHQGDREVNGGIVIPLEGTAGTTSGTWSIPAGRVLTQAERDLFIRGDLYFNVHTGTFGAGEIRGQIDLIAP